MKKIFCVMVAVVLCFGAVLVSASAETPMYNYNGVSMPYPPFDLENSDYQYLYLIEETGGSYTLIASNVRLWSLIRDASTSVYDLSIWNSKGSLIYYSISNNEWVRFGDFDNSEKTNYEIVSMDKVVWSNIDVLNVLGGLHLVGDINFSYPKIIPLHEEINGVTGEAVNGLANDTFDTLGVLVPIGIGIMAVFLGVALIPRLIHKFL